MRGFANPGSKGLSVTRAVYGAAGRGKAVESRMGEVKVKVALGLSSRLLRGPCDHGEGHGGRRLR